VSVASAPQPSPPTAGEACPLCRAPLHPDQEWCLNCGAAARTRLAAAPSWRGLATTAAVLIALSAGVLAASLVKLAADSSKAAPVSTRTVTTAALAPAPTQSSASATTTSSTGTTTKSSAGTTASRFGLSARTLERLRRLRALARSPSR
jgi:hypothetical protein